MSAEQNSLSAKKEALSRETEMYKQAIEEQVSVLKENAGQVSKKALVIGAGVVVAYFVGRAIVNKNKKKRRSANLLLPAHDNTAFGIKSSDAYARPAIRHENSNTGGIGNLIKQQITIFLIGIATQKLQQLIEGAGKDNRDPIRKHDTTTHTEPVYLH